MRAAAHVLATIVLAPYLALATGFVLLGHLASQGSLGGLLLALLDIFLWMVPWGVLALVASLVVLAGLGFSARTRRTGGACVVLLSASCIAALVLVPAAALGAGEVLFLVPCLLAGGIGAWLALMEEGPGGSRRAGPLPNAAPTSVRRP